MSKLSLYECPKFQHCNAPICPLDSDWRKRKHFNGDRVCFYLIEAQKHDSKAVFDTYGKGDLYEVMRNLTNDIANAYSPIKYLLEKAKLTSSRMIRKIGGNNAK